MLGRGLDAEGHEIARQRGRDALRIVATKRSNPECGVGGREERQAFGVGQQRVAAIAAAVFHATGSSSAACRSWAASMPSWTRKRCSSAATQVHLGVELPQPLERGARRRRLL